MNLTQLFGQISEGVRAFIFFFVLLLLFSLFPSLPLAEYGLKGVFLMASFLSLIFLRKGFFLIACGNKQKIALLASAALCGTSLSFSFSHYGAEIMLGNIYIFAVLISFIEAIREIFPPFFEGLFFPFLLSAIFAFIMAGFLTTAAEGDFLGESLAAVIALGFLYCEFLVEKKKKKTT